MDKQTELFINRVKSELQGELPGESAQFLMAPAKRGGNYIVDQEQLYRPCAVLILLCADEKGEIFIPLTERLSYAGAHSDQVCLPGGKFDEADKDLMETALRECYEEIGINEVTVIGKLSRLFIPVSRNMVEPFVGYTSIRNSAFSHHAGEVRSILKLPLTSLLDDGIRREGWLEVSGNRIYAPWFEFEGHKIWGATAMMLNEFKVLLERM